MIMKNKLKVVIVGTGYVGLTTGVCLAYLGHQVSCIDLNEKIINKLKAGQSTIHEPGIQEIMHEAGQNLKYTNSLRDELPGTDVLIIAVGTPSKTNGDADMVAVEKVAAEIGDTLEENTALVIVNKSTVPIGSARRVESVINARLEQRGVQGSFFVVSNPEFLREGAAINDTLYPDRIVVGAAATVAANTMRQLYAPILEQTFNPPASAPRPVNYELPAFITTNPTSAELIKYAANSFLAMKISFINEFAGLAERVGADINEVARGIGLDKRIGQQYLNAGLGWGGSCFGKDTRAIAYTASQYGYNMELVQSVINVNYRQRLTVVEKLQQSLKVVRGSTIGIMGLAFKPNTDDLRDAPSIDIVKKLLEHGARVKVYDPVAASNFKKQYPELDLEYCQDVISLSNGCDALVLVTEWPEFASVDWQAVAAEMRQQLLIDGRNMLNREELEKIGFRCSGVGKG